MKSALALLARFQSLDIRVWVERDQLRYRAPKGRMTPDLLDHLREHRDDLLRYLSQQAPRPAEEPITRDPAAALVMSHAQERLWFLDKLAGGSPHYNLGFGLRLRGSLDEASLAATIAAIVERHEILRTRYPVADGKATPEVRPASEMAFVIEQAPVADGIVVDPGQLLELALR